MKNVETTLKQAGLDFRHVVMSHVFLDKYENLEVTNKVYREFFEEGNEPACSTVFVDWIPGSSHVEVTCIATTDLASGRKVVRPAGAEGSGSIERRRRPPARPSGRGIRSTSPSTGRGRPDGGFAAATWESRCTGWRGPRLRSSRRPGLKLEDIASGTFTSGTWKTMTR